MWKCPKCGRTFKNVNQGHYCGKAPETVDEYILAQDEAIRVHLESVRKTLKDSLPDAVEKISWSMPTYWKDHNILHFAAAKKHIGLYPGPEAVMEFVEKLDQAGCTAAGAWNADSLKAILIITAGNSLGGFLLPAAELVRHDA